MKKKHKIIYVLNVFNKKTNLPVRILLYTNREQAYIDLAFYNATLNLRAELEYFYE